MKLLENNGYRKYKTNGKNDVTYPFSECFYQKRVTDEKGIKYHIQLICYSASPELNLKQSWLLDFSINEPFYTFREHYVKLETQEDLEKLEKKCELFWTVFKCEYYELYS